MRLHSYKARGTIATDKNGTKDNVEFLNISQDDALAWPSIARRTYPRTVTKHMEDVITPFVKKSMEMNRTFLEFFERKLQLPAGELAVQRHNEKELNGGEARCIRTPPMQTSTGVGAHTDFGSLVSKNDHDISPLYGRFVLSVSFNDRANLLVFRLSFITASGGYKSCHLGPIDGSTSR